ncbi:MAG: ClbS/DfsB family four-helix bundle protein, partial [Anaerolineae bacterium]|nr:ClbS/DfsB family four-helix bundle protein [Thermoflexales bacterium]MDW8408559.1 ClbS/DfsB family four-helix bundle protein [Anaerolineae bacterium]
MTKADLIAQLETARAALNALIAPLTADQLSAVRSTGVSIQDELAHHAACVSRMVTVVFSAERGRKPPELDAVLSGWEAVRRQDYAAQRGRPLERVLDDFHAAHRQLLRRVALWTEADLFDRSKYRWAGGRSIADLLIARVAEQDALCRARIMTMLDAGLPPEGQTHPTS